MTTTKSQSETSSQTMGTNAATDNTATAVNVCELVTNDKTVNVGDYVAEDKVNQQQQAAMNVELEKMKESAVAVEKQYKLGNKAHYTHLVELVLFYISASKINGYLNSLYTSKLSKMFKSKVDHGVNFAPLLATVWEGVEKSSVMTNKYNRNSRAMNAILNEYNANVAKYTVNKDTTVAELVAFVEEKGGINGLIDFSKENTSKKIETDFDADIELCTAEVKQDANEVEKLSQEGLKLVKSSTSYPTATFTGNVVLNKDNCSMILITKTNTGEFAVIDQITDTVLINKSLAKQCAGNFRSSPKSMRVMYETIATQCLPSSLQHTYKQLIEEAGKFTDGEKRHVARRLIYKSNEEKFLFSSIRTNSCVVTVAKPKQQVIEQVDYDLQLANVYRRELEKKIISPRLFNSYKLVDLDENEIFPANGKDFSHHISLEEITEAKDKVAHRFPVVLDGESTHAESFHQVDVADLKGKTPLWKRTVNSNWIQEFNACFTNNWIESHGKHIKRPHQTILELEFKRQLVQVNFFKKGSEYDFDLNVIVPIASGEGYGQPCNVLSKDFAVAMHALGDLPLINDVVIEVLEGALKFEYETDAAFYELYVPFVNESAERYTSAFTKYQLVRNQASPEDDPSYQTEEEMLE
jgi:hypothetical protein